MTSDQLRAALNPQAFRPFSIRTADGREYFISHPESVLFSSSGRTIAISTPHDTIEIVDLLLVASLSIGAERKTGRRRRAG
ncbi:MAG: hypothetical protein SFZ23_13835 [Planctomycetota bacterium]|nr:hypothetical protein [Planctomycetota bacterium]